MADEALQGLNRITLEFPDEKTASAFLAWFCDGGGEETFMVADRHYAKRENRHPVIRFTYERAYPAWGYDREIHGPDRVVTAYAGPPEE